MDPRSKRLADRRIGFGQDVEMEPEQGNEPDQRAGLDVDPMFPGGQERQGRRGLGHRPDAPVREVRLLIDARGLVVDVFLVDAPAIARDLSRRLRRPVKGQRLQFRNLQYLTIGEC